VTKIFADHHYATLATNDFALVANLLHAFHVEDRHRLDVPCIQPFLYPEVLRNASQHFVEPWPTGPGVLTIAS